VRRIDEEQEHLCLRRMDGGVADDAAGLVGRHEQYIRRCVVRYELLPVLRSEQRLADDLSQVCPAVAYRRVEDRSDGRDIGGNRAAQGDSGGRVRLINMLSQTW
jgi:hypothetical protein